MKKLFVLAAFAGFALSCSDDDDATETKNASLFAKWEMTKRLDFGGPTAFKSGDVTWEIASDKLTVVDKVGASYPTGVYPIALDGEFITVENGEYDGYYKYTLVDGELTLVDANMAVSDGPIFQFR